MKIHGIKIQDFQGIKSVDIRTDAPIVCIAGPNAAGKSSCRDAVRLALVAEQDRVALKKDYGALVREGAKVASIEVVTDTTTAAITITAAGKVTDSLVDVEPGPSLRLVLDAQGFSRLDSDARRRFLFSLLKVATDGESVKKRLIAHGCDAAKVDEVAPALKAGFGHAEKYAGTKTSEARGGWKAVTTESYGAVKAATWRAQGECLTEAEAAELTRLDAQVAADETSLSEARTRLGAVEQAIRNHDQYAEKLELARARGKGYADAATLAAKTQTEVVKWEGKIKAIRAATKPATAPATLLACPECASVLELRGGKLVAAEVVPIADPTPEPATKLADAEKALATLRQELARHQADVAAADRSAQDVKLMEDNAPQLPKGTPEAVKATIATMTEGIRTKQTRQSELRAKNAAAEQAGKRTKAARGHHADVQAWSAIAEALSPDGIPGQLVGEAIGPLNKRLAQSAADAGWSAVKVRPDMAIVYGDRPLNLCSESERWRADAMLAEAVSHLSGLGLLCLDRFDVLDHQGRGELLVWLDTLAFQKEINTALIFGTLKSAPTGLPDTCEVVWLMAGEAVVPEFAESEAA